KHNRHHANPNHEDEDPDIDIPALAFTTEQANAKHGLTRWVARHQAWLFFPLLCFEALMLRVSSVQALLRRELKHVTLEAIVRGGRWVDFLLGGLNYQIEHHLFPSMPRPNLRHAQILVNQFCARRDIPYSECGLLSSYAQVLRHLHAVGADLRTRRGRPGTH